MGIHFPKWADPTLSANLAQVRASGENESNEFKEGFPEQAHRVAKELAAFGTSGGGRLFIGIDDNGDLVGVDVPRGEDRDDVVERIMGIVNSIRPCLKLEIAFAVEDQRTVIVISVPKQDEPIFYYDGRPYIRDKRQSRPATPDEVKECVWSHPSSAHKREIERIHLQQMQSIVDAGRLRSERGHTPFR